MSLLYIIAVIVVVGVVMWAINAYVPMAPKFKNLLNIVVIIFLVVWLLKISGVLSWLGNVHI